MSTQGTKSKHIRAVEHAAQNPLILGLFLPLQSGAWSPSSAPRETSWTFDYNARCTVLAEKLGFDLVFGLAQWMGKGGYGGKMKFRESSTDPLIVTAGLAVLTKRIILILHGSYSLRLASAASREVRGDDRQYEWRALGTERCYRLQEERV